MVGKATCFMICSIIVISFSALVANAQTSSHDILVLKQKFDLGGERSRELQFYWMESKLISYALDGTRTGIDVFRMQLKCIPANTVDNDGDEYTCVRFTLQQGDSPEVEIPSLANWKHRFSKDSGIDEHGQVFGIDHGKFENLVDSEDKVIPPDISYHFYNAFIDFHAFCNVFTDRTNEGNGIQDLDSIGQKLVHSAAFSEPPVHLGGNVEEGSFFRNGRITLEFKGLSVVSGKPCAVVEYDSGESSFKMIMKPMPDMEIQTVGSSHYRGDIYKSLETNWVQKATMTEVVVSETTVPTPPYKINSVIEREIVIRNVKEEELGALQE